MSQVVWVEKIPLFCRSAGPGESLLRFGQTERSAPSRPRLTYTLPNASTTTHYLKNAVMIAANVIYKF